MTSLSSLDNGGISGVHTKLHKNVPAFIQVNDVIPGTIGADRDAGYTQVRVRPAVAEGQLLAHGFDSYAFSYNLYCAVDIEGDGNLTWVPCLIYKNVIDRATGKRLSAS